MHGGKTLKHIAVLNILETYIEKNSGYTTCMTSWYYQAKAFREGQFASVVYGDDSSLDRLVREFCHSLIASYSFTDGSTLKKSLLKVLDSPDKEIEENPCLTAPSRRW